MTTGGGKERDSRIAFGGTIEGGALPGGQGRPAFVLSGRSEAALPVLIAVPHAGRAYPADLVEGMRQPGDASLRLEDRFVDLVAQRVARDTGAELLLAHAPRAMIDLNRAPEDMDWDMVEGGVPAGMPRLAAGRRARSGLGLVPRRLPGMGELWKRRMSVQDLAERLEDVHRPYHRLLAQSLERLRGKWGTALLLDLHSMPPLGAKRGSDPAPDFVLGDRFGASCEGSLSMAALDHFAYSGRLAAHNRPYAGGYVLDRHGTPARGIHAMQIEICRATYLDPTLREPGPGLDGVASVIADLVRRLAAILARGEGGVQQAAE